MKHIFKFIGQTIAFVLVFTFWFTPYYIWHFKKKNDYNDFMETFEFAYHRFKRNVIGGR